MTNTPFADLARLASRHRLGMLNLVALGAVSALSLRHLDGVVAAAIPKALNSTEHLVDLIYTLSSPGILAVAPILVFLAGRFERPNARRAAQAFQVATAIIFAATIAMLLQYAVARAAPRSMSSPCDFVFFTLAPDRQSFPSLETTGLFALAGSMALIGPKYALHFWCFAAVVACAGLVVGRCWLSDILVGGEVGAGVARLVPSLLGSGVVPARSAAMRWVHQTLAPKPKDLGE